MTIQLHCGILLLSTIEEKLMKLRFGKNEWLDLEQVPLQSQTEQGVRSFALAPEAATRAASPLVITATSRAAATANRVSTQVFGKAAPSYASTAERALTGSDKVETAVFCDWTGALRVVYRELVMRFAPRTPLALRKVLLEKYNLKIRDRNSFHKDQVTVYDPTRKYLAERMVELANDLTETDEVLFAFPNFVSEFKRTAATPTPIRAQWHLATVGAKNAWNNTQGARVVVAVLDDGIDVDHPNLKPNILRKPDPNEPRDLFGRDFFVDEDTPDHFDPRPKKFRFPFDRMSGNDIHGTCCAGVVAASGNVNGVLGIAPKTRLLPVKVWHADELATESHVANAIRYASQFADILSCSWSGPASPDIELALEDAGAGRDGKGCPIFCATGNDSRNGPVPVAFPARSKFAIAVGASTNQETLADYSNRGPEVSVVAPSSGGTKSIFTTDVSTPNRGFNTGNAAAGGIDGLHTNSFGGTSSATPLVAGIAALVLSANPQLTRDEVRTLLQETSKKIGPANSYDANGHSNEFGFGRVDADKSVAKALAARAASIGGAAAAASAKKPSVRKKK